MLLTALATVALQAPIDTARYAFTIASRQEVDASAIGQGTDRTDIAATGRLLVVSRDSAGLRLVEVTIDTVAFRSGNTRVSLAALVPATGTRYTLRVDDGELVAPIGLQPRNVGATQLLGAVGLLFPTRVLGRLDGIPWTDSTVSDTTTGNGREQARTATTWRIASRNGATVALTGQTAGGSVTPFGQATLRTTTTGTHRVVTNLAGPVLSAQLEEESTQEVRGAEGIRMLGTGSRAIEVTRLP